MAAKQYVNLSGLTKYDTLIKQYISTEDAKSIKSLSVSGNTVSFFRTADASGTAAYTVNIPDVSGFMSKISSATGGKIVTSVAGGEVAESGTAISDLATNDFVGSIPSGASATTVTGYAKEVADSKDSAITAAQNAADAAQGDVDALETYVGEIPSGATATDVVGYAAEVAGDVASDLSTLENSLGTAATADVATSAITESSTDDSLVSAAQVATFVASEIAGLEGAMHFRGVITRQTGETDAEAIARVITSPEAGDVVVMSDNAKEYIYESATIGWKEVGDETEFVKKTTTIAGVDLEDNVTKSELLTALNVADGAQVNVVETVKVNGSALTPDANKAVNVTVAEGATNGTVAVNGTDVAVHGLGSAAYTASSAYDASGAAATAKSEVIGESTDAASASTIYGAKAYADAATEAVPDASIEALFS